MSRVFGFWYLVLAKYRLPITNYLFVLFPERLDLYVHARRKVELHQRVHRVLGGFEDVDQALVRADLEGLAGLLIHVRRTQHAILVLHGRQWNRPRDLRAR